jgi:hypothetical protein
MNTEKVTKLAIEMLMELRKENPDPKDELMLRMTEQRLKTLLVFAGNKKQPLDNDQGTEALQFIY